MEHQDKKLEIWREAIPKMNEEDLEFILDFPELLCLHTLTVTSDYRDTLSGAASPLP